MQKEESKGKEQIEIVVKLEQRYNDEKQLLIKAVRDIEIAESEQEMNEQLSEQAQNLNEQKIKQIVAKLLVIEKKIEELLENNDMTIGKEASIEKVEQKQEKNEENKQLQQKQIAQQAHKKYKQKFIGKSESQCEVMINEIVGKYQPTQEEIEERMNELVADPNDSNWTDATQSEADGDEIWMVDDDIIQAMEDEEGDEEIDDEEGESESEHGKQEIDFEQLQNQFVTGGESDHELIFGTHDKFCVSLNGIAARGILASGGGDDYLYLYNIPEQQLDPHPIKPYHLIKHTETINKIQFSYLKEHIFTMTDNEILCTEIKTLQTKSLKAREVKKKKEQQKENSEQKQERKQNKKGQDEDEEELEPICSDMVCHHLGDVVAVSSGFELQVYNIKGLKLYETYYCEKAINSFIFTEQGKQICLVCDDSRLRLLTPKTSEIVMISGIHQHKAQISAIKTKGDIILSGCIEGYIGISNIKKASMLTLIGSKQTEEIKGSINNLEFAGSYFIAGSSDDAVDWYDLGKAKKFIQSSLDGSSTDIMWQGKSYEHIYSVSTIKGSVYLYDCRNPLKEINRARAGNTIHKLWGDNFYLGAACEDGNCRVFDIRKFI